MTHIFLPKITEDLWELFNETCLMSLDRENNHPHWTQVAVDFVSQLQLIQVEHKEE